jgi:chaperone required for assembly of F1-ATPase
MKRIWSAARAVPGQGGFTVTLDGKLLKIPGADSLTVPFPALAEAIAAEWQSAGLDGQNIAPDDLPLTRLATTAIGRVRLARAQIIDALAAYGLHDLLCYRAETPAALVDEQAQQWQPWLDWAAQNYGLRLNTGAGITPIAQPAETAEKSVAALAPFDEFQLAALGVAIPALGSLVLGLALATGALSAQTAAKLAALDEIFQERSWGTDPDAARRRAMVEADLSACVAFIALRAP